MSTTAEILKSIKEREAYQKYIDTAFDKVDIKPKTPVNQAVDNKKVSDEPLRLQINIANDLLASILPHKAILVKEIVNYLKGNKQELNDFITYFDTFKKAVGNKIDSLETFKKEWLLFLQNDLGEILKPKQDIVIEAIPELAKDRKKILEQKSSLDLDKIFIIALEEKYGKNINEIEKFEYPKEYFKGNDIWSKEIPLIKEGDIIRFTGRGGTKSGSKDKDMNDKKIRFILYNETKNPYIGKVNWTGPIATSSVESLTRLTEQSTTGSGLQFTAKNAFMHSTPKVLKKSFKITKYP